MKASEDKRIGNDTNEKWRSKYISMIEDANKAHFSIGALEIFFEYSDGKVKMNH